MSIIVGSETRFECDEPFCSEHSVPHPDQSMAFELATKAGWSRDERGMVTCHKCRWGRDGKDGEMIRRMKAEINRLMNKSSEDRDKFLRESHLLKEAGWGRPRKMERISRCP